jgi:hypothetical protein
MMGRSDAQADFQASDVFRRRHGASHHARRLHQWIAVIGRKPKSMTANYEQAAARHIIDLLEQDGRTVALIELVPKPSAQAFRHQAIKYRARVSAESKISRCCRIGTARVLAACCCAMPRRSCDHAASTNCDCIRMRPSPRPAIPCASRL